MKKPEIPKNETERLAELDSYQIIDEMEEFDYDFLTQMASQICGTKISLISLITHDKQWFLSHHGLPTRETPRDFAFCAHAINNPEDVFIIEDARKEERFYDNPFVIGFPNVIFYAGVSLINENGYPLGTLCVIDNEPHQLNKQQIESLKMLSRQVMNLLELRRKTKKLKQVNAKLSNATILFNESQRMNKIGAWDLDLKTGVKTWTDEMYTIHEVPKDFDHNKEKGVNFFHPEDQHIISKAVQNTIATGAKFEVICRLISAKGNLKWVKGTGSLWNSMDENPKLIGSFQDITDIKNAEEKLEEALAKNEAIFDASTQVSIISTDPNGLITEFNKGAELQLGYSAQEMIGIQTPQIIHIKEEVENVANELSQKMGRKIEGFEIFAINALKDIPETREWTYLRKNGTKYTVLLSITAIKKEGKITGFLGVAIDITEMKKVEKEIMSLLEITKDQNNQLKNFAHIVSHNLRSHSGGILMLLDFLKEESPEIYAKELFQHIRNASENLAETIKHLSDVVQINLGTKENRTPVFLKPVVEQNISSLLAMAQKANVTIVNDVPDHVKVSALPAYLDSIIMNFLSNGIKYSSNERASFVKIEVEEKNDFIILIFGDNGLGIDLKKHGHKLFGIYKTFHDHEDSRGVGLFMTKNQVEAMGGHIEVESKENVGTTFKIYLVNEKK